MASERADRLERRVAELEAQLDQQLWVYEVEGDQVVEVGRYSYRLAGEPPLAIGDKVLLPENWLSAIKDGHGPQVGTITGFGTRYQGQLARILRRLPD